MSYITYKYSAIPYFTSVSQDHLRASVRTLFLFQISPFGGASVQLHGVGVQGLYTNWLSA